MVDLTKLALFKHYSTLCKHYTDSAITYTALRNVKTITRNDNLSPCQLVVDSNSIPDRPASSSVAIPTELPGLY